MGTILVLQVAPGNVVKCHFILWGQSDLSEPSPAYCSVNLDMRDVSLDFSSLYSGLRGKEKTRGSTLFDLSEKAVFIVFL